MGDLSPFQIVCELSVLLCRILIFSMAFEEALAESLKLRYGSF